MSFLDTVELPTQTSITAPRSGGFLSSVTMPKSDNIEKSQSELQVAKANSDYASSWQGMLKNTISSIPETSPIKAGIEAIQAPIEQARQGGTEAATGLKEGNIPKIISGAIHTALGTVGAGLSPISAIFSIAEKTPILKPAADIMGLPFMVTGKVGEFLGDKFTDVLPISKESKDILRPALKEVGALTGQLYLGGKVMKMIESGEVLDKTKIQSLKEEAKAQIPETQVIEHTPIEKKLSKVIADYKAEGFTIPELSQERQPRSPGLRDLTKLSNHPEVEALTKKKVEDIPKNSDGTITVYRAGNVIPENKISSVTLDRSVAEIINQEKVRGGYAKTKEEFPPINEYQVKPEDVKIAILGSEKELLVDTKAIQVKNRFLDSVIQPEEKKIINKSVQKEIAYRGEGGVAAGGKFESANQAILGEGIYSTPSREHAALYGKVREVTDIPKKPLDISYSELTKLYDKIGDTDKNIKEYIQNLGYDGIRIVEKNKVIEQVKYVDQLEGQKMTSGLAKNVEQNAIERKLTEGLGQLPEYNKVNMKEQTQHAVDLLRNEPEKAMRVAMGQELPPNHILPEAIFTAVENKAVTEKDVETLRKLATESNLSLQATAMGQRIRALGERDQESPVGLIQSIKTAREIAIEKKTGKKVRESQKEIVGEIKKEIKKPTKETWASFIESIKCNY